MADTIRVGLRFRRRDVARLLACAERVRHMEIGDQHVGLWDSAADAARTGEPLIVQCGTAEEARAMADAFVAYGITRPAVEELTGQRPSS